VPRPSERAGLGEEQQENQTLLLLTGRRGKVGLGEVEEHKNKTRLLLRERGKDGLEGEEDKHKHEYKNVYTYN
jgi:hypothetical protein